MRNSLLVAILLMSSAVSAQVDQGDIEIGGSAAFQIFDGNAFLALTPTVGLFVTDAIEVGLNPQIITDFEDGTVFLTAFGAYHFNAPGKRTVPFVGANLGASLTDGGGLALGAQGGIKHFFSPGGAVTLAAVLNTNDDFDPVVLGVQAGVSIFISR